MNAPVPEKVALIIHPPQVEPIRAHVQETRPGKEIPDQLLIKLLEWGHPFKVKDLPGLSYDGNTSIEAVLIFVPFLPEMKNLEQEKVFRKVDEALGIARQEGCTVAGMAAFTSIVIQGREQELSEKHNLRITSGNALTAALIIRSIEETAQRFGLDLRQSTLAVIGASGDIGSGCAAWFGARAGKMILTARGIKPVQDMVERLGFDWECGIEITTDNQAAIAHADIAIFVTSAPDHLFDLDQMRPRSIICDASAPPNVRVDPIQLREDVFVYHGGVASVPFSVLTEGDFGLPPRTLYGCLTESILNGLHPDLPLSQGRGGISVRKIQRLMEAMGRYPAVRPAFTIGNREYSDGEMKGYAERWKVR